MNPQPESLQIFVCTAIWFFFVYLFLRNPKNHYNFSDKFIIGHIEDDNVSSEYLQEDDMDWLEEEEEEKPKKKAKRNPARPSKSKAKRNSNGYTDLQQDCYEALRSLGVKTARERKFVVNNTFNQHNPKTVEEFLSLAMVRGN